MVLVFATKNLTTEILFFFVDAANIWNIFFKYTIFFKQLRQTKKNDFKLLIICIFKISVITKHLQNNIRFDFLISHDLILGAYVGHQHNMKLTNNLKKNTLLDTN